MKIPNRMRTLLDIAKPEAWNMRQVRTRPQHARRSHAA